MKTDTLREESEEKFAIIIHDVWNHWQKYIQTKIMPSAKDGIMEIGEDYVFMYDVKVAINNLK